MIQRLSVVGPKCRTNKRSVFTKGTHSVGRFSGMRRLVGYLGITVLLIGCGFGEALSGGDNPGTELVDLTPAALIGLWSNNRGDTLEFTSDGDFYGDNVRYMFTGDLARHVDLSADTVPGSGHWRITTPLGVPDGKRALVGLRFDVVGRHSAAAAIDKLRARRDGDQIILVYYMGDPDLNQAVAYRRCESGCRSPVPDHRSLGAPSTADPERLAGSWVDQHGMRLVLASHGGFTAEDLRFAFAAAPILLPAGVSLEEPLSAEGSWSIKAPEHDPF
jgi:hypothetical protein